MITVLANLSLAQEECDMRQLKSSKMDLTVSDVDFMTRIMSFSYENEASKLIPELKSSFSGLYYKGSKNEPLATYLFTSYKSKAAAQSAANYLKARWMAKPNDQYDVIAQGLDVLWFGNNSLSAPCFKKIVATEKSKVFRK